MFGKTREKGKFILMNQGQGAFRSSRRTRAPVTRLDTKLQHRSMVHPGDGAADKAAAQVQGSPGSHGWTHDSSSMDVEVRIAKKLPPAQVYNPPRRQLLVFQPPGAFRSSTCHSFAPSWHFLMISHFYTAIHTLNVCVSNPCGCSATPEEDSLPGQVVNNSMQTALVITREVTNSWCRLKAPE